MKVIAQRICPLFLLCVVSALGATEPHRQVWNLDGTWQVAEGKLEQQPAVFDHTVPVPGLLDMAQPPFESPGNTIELKNRTTPGRPADPLREAFWYRRTFRLDGSLPAVALLKVNKACYGTKVFVNGQVVGEYLPNFTPGWFDVLPFLKSDGGENELIIRVGASLAQIPPQISDGYDIEKSRYIPGIYDSVQLILSGTPHIVNVQTVPDVEKKSVRAVIELANAGTGSKTVAAQCVVREKKSGKIVGEAVAGPVTVVPGQTAKADVVIAIRDAKLWSPENPFLYELEVDTGADRSVTRFGLRSIRFDPNDGCAYLNGKKYFLRGSNVCIYRFFEDAVRGALPWDETWVRNLHRKFKEMHWNSLRYCIGFPPERWYEIADEEGILIQDEFPVWNQFSPNRWPAAVTVAGLAAEYTEWMRERWNHPCVAIWDAQNETSNDSVTGPAIMAVRDLDLSRRSWDNGWGTPQRPGDISECHPYRSGHTKGLPNFATEDGVPNVGPGFGIEPFVNKAKPPYLINEYGWLWINRDGSLPTLTTALYGRILGSDVTVEQRWQYYARTLAAKTEFWRSHRKCAGVLHFCGLGYSRPDGQTSDNFIDVKNLVFEPNFFRYVRDAFAPVGLMLDFWESSAIAGEKKNLRIAAVNDLDAAWNGTVRLRMLNGTTVLSEQMQPLAIPALGEAEIRFDCAMPLTLGDYTLEAALIRNGETPVCSLRDVTVTARNSAKSATASSEMRLGENVYSASLAVDGKTDTRWSSEFKDGEWLAVDMGESKTVSGVELLWETACAADYVIEVSTDGFNWQEAARNFQGAGKTERIEFAPVQARWIRMRALKRATGYGVSLWEFRVLEPDLTGADKTSALQKNNLALDRSATASSEVRNELGFFPAQLAVDGRSTTRWSSEGADNQWLAVDLGETKTVSSVELLWEAACAAEYVIEVSNDGEQWTEVARNLNGKGGIEQLKFAPVKTRWIRMRALKRATVCGVSLWEFRVLEK